MSKTTHEDYKHFFIFIFKFFFFFFLIPLFHKFQPLQYFCHIYPEYIFFIFSLPTHKVWLPEAYSVKLAHLLQKVALYYFIVLDVLNIYC